MLTKKLFLQALPTLHELEPTADTCELFNPLSNKKFSCGGCPFYLNNSTCYTLTSKTYVAFLTKNFPELLI